MEVVGLGARCDVDARSADEGRADFSVSEFAVLADGRTLTLHDDRGFSSWGSTGGPWLRLTIGDVTRSVLTTVLPDDDDDGEAHPWDWLAELLAVHGVETSPEQLKQVPYTVILSERLLARLQAGG
jgi:hypothetical protein